MSRYIDAEALDNRIKAEWAKQEDDKGYGLAHFFVETQPTVDVAPVVHAKWMGGGGFFSPYCSNCKKYSPRGERFNYCPHCGARMDEEVDK